MTTVTANPSTAPADPYFQKLFADRIGGVNYGKGTAIYKFEKIKTRQAKSAGRFPDRRLLDFGIGENDSMADSKVRQRLAEEANRPENRGYADNGIAEYREAVARFMQRWFGVSLDLRLRSITASGRRPRSQCCLRLLHQSG